MEVDWADESEVAVEMTVEEVLVSEGVLVGGVDVGVEVGGVEVEEEVGVVVDEEVGVTEAGVPVEEGKRSVVN